MAMHSDASYAADMRAEINMTPLIDVMLALVVVFMIAAPLLSKRLTLPLASSNEPAPAVESVRLAIASDGSLSWNDRALPSALLREQLRVLAHSEPQPELRIEIAPAASYQTFATVLADAKAASIVKIGVQTDAAR